MVRIAPTILPLLALALPTRADLSKPALMDGLDKFWPKLQMALREPGFTVKEWPQGTLSDDCLQTVKREKVNPRDFVTYEVTYGDCAMPWLLCRHRNHTVSLQTMATRFGQVPVKMRQATKAVTFIPPGKADTKDAAAYALGNQVVFLNEPMTVGVYIHEVGHTVDLGGSNTSLGDGKGRLTHKKVWLDGYRKDSAVPDDYARTNQDENLAQFFGITLFDELVPGGIKTVEPRAAALRNQMDVLKDQAKNAPYGGNVLGQNEKCSRRYPNSAAVTVNGSKVRRDVFGFLKRRDDSFKAQLAVAKAAGFELAEDVPMEKQGKAIKCQRPH